MISRAGKGVTHLVLRAGRIADAIELPGSNCGAVEGHGSSFSALREHYRFAIISAQAAHFIQKLGFMAFSGFSSSGESCRFELARPRAACFPVSGQRIRQYHPPRIDRLIRVCEAQLNGAFHDEEEALAYLEKRKPEDG